MVQVVADISLTNTIPDTLEGSSINRRFFSGFSLPVPVGATNQVAVTANGGPLGLTSRLIDGNGDFFVLDIDLAGNLFYQQTAQVTVKYDITGLLSRSANPSRVNAAYAAFDAFGIGDDGKVTVRVVVPPGFRIDTFGDDAVISQENGNTEGATWAPPLVVRQRMSAWSFGSAQEAIEGSEAVLALRSELDGKTTALGSSYPSALEAAHEGSEANLDDAKDAVQQQIDSADRLLAAVAANEESDGLFGELGLIGTNLPALLGEARAALAVGDYERARSTAKQVLDTVERAPDVGKKRALWAGGGVLSMLLLTLLIVVLRCRQRRRPRNGIAA